MTRSRSRSRSKSRARSRKARGGSYKVGQSMKFYPFSKNGVTARISSIKSVKNPKTGLVSKIAYANIGGKKVGNFMRRK